MENFVLFAFGFGIICRALIPAAKASKIFCEGLFLLGFRFQDKKDNIKQKQPSIPSPSDTDGCFEKNN